MVSEELRASEMVIHRESRGADFHQAALRYAQSLWMAGKPAQAILQINKSFMAHLERGTDIHSYHALGWIMNAAADGESGFLGNPVRHFQHLATRMSGPQKEIRTWRAWACFHLAEKILPSGYSRDGRQMIREGIWIPGLAPVLAALERNGWKSERSAFLDAYRMP